ncbi:MAG: hypothetical protein AAF327_14035 [Cyanobacteria bacterium P01_A01_bin.37]
MKINPSSINSELEGCYGGAWVASEITMGYLLGVFREGDLYTGLALQVGGNDHPIGTEPFSDPQDAMGAIRQMALEWHTQLVGETWKYFVDRIAESN